MTHHKSEKPKPFGVRMDDDIREWLEERARQNNRSMNAEVITIFQGIRRQEAEQKQSRVIEQQHPAN